MNRVGFRLTLVSDRRQTVGRPLLSVVEAALRGGVEALQVREKDLPARALLDLSGSLRERTTRTGARLFINDRADICRAVAADGVHLRADHLPVPIVRRMIGHGGERGERLIGVSVHSADAAGAAEAEGADFILLGPIYETSSKRAFGLPLGLRAIEAIAPRLSIPVFAIGGVTRARVAEVMDAGAWGIAVIAAILSAPDPEQAAAALRDEIAAHAGAATRLRRARGTVDRGSLR